MGSDRQQPSVAVIEDLSGAGKCSLTVALPILSAAGVSCSVLPTAVLSTHPGGFTGYTYRDLTEDLLPSAQHWHREGLRFNAIYSGFLGSDAQLDILEQILDMNRENRPLILVDPVMGDNGKLYSVFSSGMVTGMRRLCARATIITPNVTEAAFLAGDSYQEGPYTSEYVESLARRLAKLGAQYVIITGVYVQVNEIGAICYDASSDTCSPAYTQRTPGYYHGTGDAFGAALLAGVLQGLSVTDAMKNAVDFLGRCIRRTAKAGTPVRLGLCFEPELPSFGKKLQERRF